MEFDGSQRSQEKFTKSIIHKWYNEQRYKLFIGWGGKDVAEWRTRHFDCTRGVGEEGKEVKAESARHHRGGGGPRDASRGTRVGRGKLIVTITFLFFVLGQDINATSKYILESILTTEYATQNLFRSTCHDNRSPLFPLPHHFKSFTMVLHQPTKLVWQLFLG